MVLLPVAVQARIHLLTMFDKWCELEVREAFHWWVYFPLRYPPLKILISNCILRLSNYSHYRY